MNENQLFRDENTEPTGQLIAQGLVAANDAYTKFLEKLKPHSIELEWRYYKDGKAWLGKGLYKWTTSRGTQKETTAFWLSMWEGFFKVVIYIPEKYRAEALGLSLGGEVRGMIENAKQIGKLKFFPLIFDLRSGQMFEEIFTVIDFRKLR